MQSKTYIFSAFYLSLLFFCVSNAFGQNQYFSRQFRLNSQFPNGIFNNIQATNTGGFLVNGSVFNPVTNQGKIYTQNYDASGLLIDEFSNSSGYRVQLSNGDFLAYGTNKIWRYAPDGRTLIWAKVHHANLGQYFDIRNVMELANGNIILRMFFLQNGSNNDEMVECIDAQGNLIWTQNFHSNKMEYFNIRLAKDGNVWLIGTDKTINSQAFYGNITVVKLDKNTGQMLSLQAYGYPLSLNSGYTFFDSDFLHEFDNGEMIISHTGYLLRLNALGEVKWSKQYVDINSRDVQLFYTKSGDILFLPQYFGAINSRRIFGKLDANGDVLWCRKTPLFCDKHYILTCLELPNKDLVFGGSLGINSAFEQPYLLKTNSLGLLPNCRNEDTTAVFESIPVVRYNSTITPENINNVTLDDTLAAPIITEQIMYIDKCYKPLTLVSDTLVCDFPINLVANTSYYSYFQWNTGSTAPTLTVNSEGKYWIKGVFQSCAPFTDTITVKQRKIEPLSFADTLICATKLPITYTVPSAYTGAIWSNGNPTKSITIAESGTYTVTASWQCGNTSKTFTVVTETPILPFSIGNDTTACENGHFVPLTLQTSQVLPNYLWNTGSTTPTITATQANIYSLQSRNTCGTVESTIKIKDCEPAYYIPTVFSPNNDRNNDYFTLFANSAITKIVTMKIFDRSGELVFERHDFSPNVETNGWDGTFKGQTLLPDVFVYLFEVEFSDGKRELLKGDITILK